MSNNPNAFIATIFYTDHDGAAHTVGAVVLAVDEMDAVQTAIEAVSSLPHCARVDGGIIEPAPEPATDDVHHARESEAETPRPAGATVH